jgi:hypothetical protein
MKQGIVKGVMVGTMCAVLMLPSVLLAGQGHGAGKGPALQNQPRNMEQIREQKRLEHRYLPVESGKQTSNTTKKGHAYGPGDGTGNDGIGPRDGTGYGAPSQR